MSCMKMRVKFIGDYIELLHKLRALTEGPVGALRTLKKIYLMREREKIMIKYPDYENCIVNLAASVLQEFGVDTGETKGLPVCKELFTKNYKNIVVLLLDGMGISVMEKNLKKSGFFRSHLVQTYSSVFPPTTVASTTSVDCGKYPAEHGWLGWDCYYPELDENVTVFLNVKQGTEEPAADFFVAGKYCGYENMVSQIQAAGGQAYYSTPFAYPNPGDFDAVLERIADLCKRTERNIFMHIVMNRTTPCTGRAVFVRMQ